VHEKNRCLISTNKEKVGLLKKFSKKRSTARIALEKKGKKNKGIYFPPTKHRKGPGGKKRGKARKEKDPTKLGWGASALLGPITERKLG